MKPTADGKDTRELQARVRAWTREALGLVNPCDEDIPITVSELRCAEEGCPDVETVIGVLYTNPRRISKYKVFMALQDVKQEDVVKACRVAQS